MMEHYPTLQLGWQDWLQLGMHYMMLSLLAVGGAISTLPEMHRYLVTQHGWLSESQFNASISIAQAAPGPNILFVALLGWHVGINNGGIAYGLLGVAICMAGILLPSTTLTFLAARWLHAHRDLRSVRAFKLGMAPIVIGLLMATSWLMAAAQPDPQHDWPLWALSAVCTLVVWRTRLHLLWLLGLGALLGALGWV